jgi:hypothetical protein
LLRRSRWATPRACISRSADSRRGRNWGRVEASRHAPRAGTDGEARSRSAERAVPPDGLEGLAGAPPDSDARPARPDQSNARGNPSPRSLSPRSTSSTSGFRDRHGEERRPRRQLGPGRRSPGAGLREPLRGRGGRGHGRDRGRRPTQRFSARLCNRLQSRCAAVAELGVGRREAGPPRELELFGTEPAAICRPRPPLACHPFRVRFCSSLLRPRPRPGCRRAVIVSGAASCRRAAATDTAKRIVLERSSARSA